MEPAADTRYAVAPDGAYIVYQTIGTGPVDLVWQSDRLSDFDINWEYPTASEVATFPGDIEPTLEEMDAHTDRIRRFIGVEAPVTGFDSVLATIVFTDIVGSTEKQASLGDHGWKNLVEEHHSVVPQALKRCRGDEIDTAGDGFFATIDGRIGGLSVSIGAQVASHAGPSEVLISQTVKDLVAGSGLTFEAAGEHELKGVPDRWHLYRVIA
jgi:class 3 adenylate cyclase